MAMIVEMKSDKNPAMAKGHAFGDNVQRLGGGEALLRAAEHFVRTGLDAKPQLDTTCVRHGPHHGLVNQVHTPKRLPLHIQFTTPQLATEIRHLPFPRNKELVLEEKHIHPRLTVEQFHFLDNVLRAPRETLVAPDRRD